MQKGSSPILILLTVIILGALGIYLFAQNSPKNVQDKLVPPTPPTEEQLKQIRTYNETLGFEFVVPEGFSVVEETEEQFHKRSNGEMRKNFTNTLYYEPAKFVSSFYVLNSDKDYEKSPLSIWVFENPDNLDPGTFYDKYWYYPFIWGDFTSAKDKIAPTEKIMVGEASGSGSIVDYRTGTPHFIYLQNSGKMYLLRVVGNTDILKTFKFTK